MVYMIYTNIINVKSRIIRKCLIFLWFAVIRFIVYIF
jgi:hypothetical protein